MIIDSLLKEYDRRATPTNRMGKKQFEKNNCIFYSLYFHFVPPKGCLKKGL